MRPVILAQEFPVRGPANLIADAVEVQADAANVEPGKPVPPQHDGFHVEQGARVPDGFDPKLMEFVKTARLWAFGSEIGAHVVEAHRLPPQLHTGVEITTYEAGRPPLPQLHQPPAPLAQPD